MSSSPRRAWIEIENIKDYGYNLINVVLPTEGVD